VMAWLKIWRIWQEIRGNNLLRNLIEMPSTPLAWKRSQKSIKSAAAAFNKPGEL
jgi:hypothetical protein